MLYLYMKETLAKYKIIGSSLLCLPFRPSVQTRVAVPSSHPCPPSEVQTACLSVVVPTSVSRCRWVRLSARLFCVCAPFSNAPELGNWEVEFTLIFQAWRIGWRSQWMLTYTLSVTGTLWGTAGQDFSLASWLLSPGLFLPHPSHRGFRWPRGMVSCPPLRL